MKMRVSAMGVILTVLGTAGICLAAAPATNEANQNKTPAPATAAESGQQCSPVRESALRADLAGDERAHCERE